MMVQQGMALLQPSFIISNSHETFNEDISGFNAKECWRNPISGGYLWFPKPKDKTTLNLLKTFQGVNADECSTI